jgi:N-methylhydantoinase A/oxoprolinase/acetone carboxylase beta subunit
VLGEANIVGVDMGGTSFDVSVVREGKVNLVTQGEIDKMPVRLPMVEIRTIGAGGGSIATVRAGGRLTVGPESAGSRPGPACYGRGGTEPTSRTLISCSGDWTAKVSSAAACGSIRLRLGR